MIKFKYDKNLCNWYFTLDDYIFYIVDIHGNFYNNDGYSYGFFQIGKRKLCDTLNCLDVDDVYDVLNKYVKEKKLRFDFKYENNHYYSKVDYEYTISIDIENLKISVYKIYHSCIFKNVDSLVECKELAIEYLKKRVLPQQLAFI